MILYFIRHGETNWNKEKRLQGQTDIPLNENGRNAAIEARERIKDIEIDIAFSSPLVRAQETARLVLGKRDIPMYLDERIQEISFGEEEGKVGRDKDNNPIGSFYNFFNYPEKYKAPENGEDVIMLYTRTKDFLEDIISREELQDKSILIATHGAALQAMMLWINKEPIADLWKSGLKKNCSITKAEAKDGIITILEEGERQYTQKELSGK